MSETALGGDKGNAIPSTAIGGEKRNTSAVSTLSRVRYRLKGYYCSGMELLPVMRSKRDSECTPCAHCVPTPHDSHERRVCVCADVATGHPLSVTAQVDRLLAEATSEDNLSRMYIGWMPFL